MAEGRHALASHEVGTRPQTLSQLHANILDVFIKFGEQILPHNVIAQPAQPVLVACGKPAPTPARAAAASP